MLTTVFSLSNVADAIVQRYLFGDSKGTFQYFKAVVSYRTVSQIFQYSATIFPVKKEEKIEVSAVRRI